MNETKTKNRTKSKGKQKEYRRRSFDPLLFLNATGIGRRPEAHRKHEVVFSEGEPSKHVYYIRDGGIKLSVNSKEGKVAVVGILGPTDFFGEDGIAGTKVCMSEVEVRPVPSQSDLRASGNPLDCRPCYWSRSRRQHRTPRLLRRVPPHSSQVRSCRKSLVVPDGRTTGSNPFHPSRGP